MATVRPLYKKSPSTFSQILMSSIRKPTASVILETKTENRICCLKNVSGNIHKSIYPFLAKLLVCIDRVTRTKHFRKNVFCKVCITVYITELWLLYTLRMGLYSSECELTTVRCFSSILLIIDNLDSLLLDDAWLTLFYCECCLSTHHSY